MTGFGDARCQDEQLSAAVEIRTVNNRYLKVAVRLPEFCAAAEGTVEGLVRQGVSRGTVNVSVRLESIHGATPLVVDETAVRSLWPEIQRVADAVGASAPADLTALLAVPGIVTEATGPVVDPDLQRRLIEQTVGEALASLQTFRRREGESMELELQRLCGEIESSCRSIAEHAPRVVSAYRDRIVDRVNELLTDFNVKVEPADVIREVSIFAEKADINEELTRLQCHTDQFREFLSHDQSQGRKLEFLSQEMNREVNTIGAKANDVAIAHTVVEMKSAIEKIREILQNVE